MPSVRSPARMSGLPHRTEGGQLSATASCAKRPNSKNASRRHHFRPFEPPLKTSLLGVVLQTHAPNHARERERQEEGGGSKPSVDSEKPWSTDRPRDGPPAAGRHVPAPPPPAPAPRPPLVPSSSVQTPPRTLHFTAPDPIHFASLLACFLPSFPLIILHPRPRRAVIFSFLHFASLACARYHRETSRRRTAHGFLDLFPPFYRWSFLPTSQVASFFSFSLN
jgi:hypothetical protein